VFWDACSGTPSRLTTATRAVDLGGSAPTGAVLAVRSRCPILGVPAFARRGRARILSTSRKAIPDWDGGDAHSVDFVPFMEPVVVLLSGAATARRRASDDGRSIVVQVDEQLEE